MTREWRTFASCRDLAPAFDYSVDGESAKHRESRLAAAVAVCKQCPVRAACEAAIDPLVDDGVRAGVVLGAIAPVRNSKSGAQKMAREHGSERGWRQHIDRGDKPPCQPCKTAHRAAESRRRRMATVA